MDLMIAAAFWAEFRLGEGGVEKKGNSTIKLHNLH